MGLGLGLGLRGGVRLGVGVGEARRYLCLRRLVHDHASSELVAEGDAVMLNRRVARARVLRRGCLGHGRLGADRRRHAEL